ncbi:MAG TPA: hypothetical protein PLZ01_15745, partial [bacterium]|nr:hypothetical protein [bacterium]
MNLEWIWRFLFYAFSALYFTITIIVFFTGSKICASCRPNRKQKTASLVVCLAEHDPDSRFG